MSIMDLSIISQMPTFFFFPALVHSSSHETVASTLFGMIEVGRPCRSSMNILLGSAFIYYTLQR